MLSFKEGVDEGVGRITNLLEEKKMLENTIIIFSSDNGGVPYAGAFNYPFRGGKATLYEGGVRSAGFIHAPTFFPPGGFEYKDLFHVTDFFPTLSAMINSDMKHSGGNLINQYTSTLTM